MDYSEIRGFNVHGDWGSHGITEWLLFDKDRYKKMIAIGKERFPKMNTVRIWFSFDAYIADKKKYLENAKTATNILTEAGLNIIPVYFNGWMGVPSFGGFTYENVKESQYPPYIRFVKDTTRLLKDANVLIIDIANEPFNNGWSNPGFDIIVNFLKRMAQTVREMDSRPITVGSQGYPPSNYREFCDIDHLAPFVDVISLHPYNIEGLSMEEFDKRFVSIMEYLKSFNKPYIITESMWGTPTAEARVPYLETEFNTYTKHKVGFLCHALFTSPVADLHPVEEIGVKNGLYMAFLDKNFNIRPHHDIFNRYS